MSSSDKIHVAYYTDMLCIWAYLSQIRLSELKKQFGEQIQLSYHFIPIFGCTEQRIGSGWKDRGGFNGYAEHVQEVSREFPHIDIGADVWRLDIPKSSATSHLFLKSVQLLEEKSIISTDALDEFDGNTLFEEASWILRQAFFAEGNNIAKLDSLFEITRPLNLPIHEIKEQFENGEAMAAMCRDAELSKQMHIDGSPTYLLNEGRQKLYGNLGYKIIEANVQEILNRPGNQASWC